MSEAVLTLEPEALTSEDASPSWAESLIGFVRRAAQLGETVMVSTKPKMMTPAEVARGLNMSRSTVSRKIAAGEIHSVKVGNRHRIPYTEFRHVWTETMHRFAAAEASDLEADLFGDD
ncbi:MAG: helix-turn-helix domain-containing protein [Bifidobacteriaceae bacterium]|jgi:excisionase family DNA binding protein|nr:helix-turn-helix domain-containing protein [Bifidobacteriaceae bacterium]